MLAVCFSGAAIHAQEQPDQFPEAGAREENFTMRITARVINEEGKPMAGVPIRIGIHNVNDYKDQYNDFRGKTDAEGKFSAEGIGRPLAKIEVKKKGYYVSRKTYTCYDGTEEKIRKSGHYYPWDPVVDLVIKKIGKPIPMIVRLAGGGCKSWCEPTADQMGKELRWDLEKGEWLPPYGKGKKADLILKFESSYTDEANKFAKLFIKFANPDDGFVTIQRLEGEESLLRFPREAPKRGYGIKTIDLFTKSFGDWSLSKNRPKGYFFRIRTQKDKAGKVVSAIYGKITKPFCLYPPAMRYRLPVMKFDYYLNPTPNDRNLEFDQIHNLAPDAPKGARWLP